MSVLHGYASYICRAASSLLLFLCSTNLNLFLVLSLHCSQIHAYVKRAFHETARPHDREQWKETVQNMIQNYCESRTEKVKKQREVTKKAESKREEIKYIEKVFLNRLHFGSGEFLLTLVSLTGVGS